MAALEAAIQEQRLLQLDGRVKPGHDKNCKTGRKTWDTRDGLGVQTTSYAVMF